jgi:3'(2'), 5'-bisphosphate nucleotidase
MGSSAASRSRAGTASRTAPPRSSPHAAAPQSQCKYAVVARGQAHAYLRLPTKAGYVERIWDHAAGSLVATEAGALVTDIDGKPLDFSHGRGLETNRGIVAASAALHPRLIEAIARS